MLRKDYQIIYPYVKGSRGIFVDRGNTYVFPYDAYHPTINTLSRTTLKFGGAVASNLTDTWRAHTHTGTGINPAPIYLGGTGSASGAQVTGTLPQSFINHIYGESITTGYFSPLQLPRLSHIGRVDEVCSPVEAVAYPDPSGEYKIYKTDPWSGTIIVKKNGYVITSGFTLNASAGTITFTEALAVTDSVTVITQMTTFLPEKGAWDTDNVVAVRVNGTSVATGFSVVPSAGQIIFTTPLAFTDSVEVDIFGTNISNVGTAIHEDIDRLVSHWDAFGDIWWTEADEQNMGQLLLTMRKTYGVKLLSANQMNGGEDGTTTGFNSISSATLSSDTAKYKTGTHSIKVVCPGSVANEGVAVRGYTSQHGQFGGKTWIYGDSGTVNVYLRVTYSDSTYTNSSPIPTITLAGAWQEITTPTVVSDTSKTITTASLMVRSVGTQAVTFWIDDISIGFSGSPYTPSYDPLARRVQAETYIPSLDASVIDTDNSTKDHDGEDDQLDSNSDIPSTPGSPVETYIYGQSFTALTGMESIARISLKLAEVGSFTGTAALLMYPAKTGIDLPDEDNLIFSQALDTSKLTGFHSWVAFDTPGATVTAGEKYVIVLSQTGYNFDNYVSWKISSEEYSAGTGVAKAVSSGVWQVEDYDRTVNIDDTVIINDPDTEGEPFVLYTLGQSFTMPAGVTSIGQVKLYLAKTGTPNYPLLIGIHPVQAGTDYPSMGEMIGSSVVYTQAVSSDGGWVTFDFFMELTVTAGAKYVAVLYQYGMTTDGYVSWRTSLDAYADGTAIKRPVDSDTWVTENFDRTLQVDNSVVITNPDTGGGTPFDTYTLGQSFTATGVASLTKIKLYLAKVGDGCSTVVKVYETQAGTDYPATSYSTSATVTADALSSDGSWVSYTFSPAVSLMESAKYAIVLEETDPTSANCAVWATSSDTYAGGTAIRKLGSTWSSQDFDRCFTVNDTAIVVDDPEGGGEIWKLFALGQRFVAEYDNLSKLELYLSRLGDRTDYTLTAKIHPVTGTTTLSIDTSTLVGSVEMTADKIFGEGRDSWITFAPATPITLTAGNKYAIVLDQGTFDTTNYVEWWYSSESYPNGEAWHKELPSGTWEIEGSDEDRTFRLWGRVDPATLIGTPIVENIDFGSALSVVVNPVISLVIDQTASNDNSDPTDSRYAIATQFVSDIHAAYPEAVFDPLAFTTSDGAPPGMKRYDPGVFALLGGTENITNNPEVIATALNNAKMITRENTPLLSAVVVAANRLREVTKTGGRFDGRDAIIVLLTDGVENASNVALNDAIAGLTADPVIQCHTIGYGTKTLTQPDMELQAKLLFGLASGTEGHAYFATNPDLIPSILTAIRQDPKWVTKDYVRTKAFDDVYYVQDFSLTGTVPPTCQATYTVRYSEDGVVWTDVAGVYSLNATIAAGWYAEYIEFTIHLIAGSTPTVDGGTVTIYKPVKNYVYTNTFTATSQLQEIMVSYNRSTLPANCSVTAGICQGDLTNWDYYTKIGDYERQMLPERTAERTTADITRTIFTLKWGAFLPDSAVEVYLGNTKADLDSYIIRSGQGQIIFTEPVESSVTVTVSIVEPKTFRIGFKTLRIGETDFDLGEFAFLYTLRQ